MDHKDHCQDVYLRYSSGGRYVLVGHELRRVICEDATGLRWERVGDIEAIVMCADELKRQLRTKPWTLA